MANTFLAGLPIPAARPGPIGAQASVSIAGAIAVTNSVKTSIATVAGPVTYSGVQLNGTTAGSFVVPRTVSVTTSAHAASYVLVAITINGTDSQGTVISDTLTLTQVNGGETLTTAKAFMTVTSIVIPAMNDTLGAFTFGTNDIFLPNPPSRVFIGTSAPGNLHVGYGVSSGAAILKDTIPKLPIGIYQLSPQFIYGDSTVSDISLWF